MMLDGIRLRADVARVAMAAAILAAATLWQVPTARATPPSFCSETPPNEIVELARALKNDPDLIYEYIYNNIKTLPQYGSLKGPLGALVDGTGTSFDQAELMAELLTIAAASNSTISSPIIETGTIQLTAAQLTAWVGTDTNPGSVGQILGSGGFTGGLNPPGGSSVTSATLNWAWVKVQINGTSVVFDPATKTYNQISSLANLESVLGYTQSTFISRAESGATIGPHNMFGLAAGRANLRSDLASFSTNLVSYLKANNRTATIADVIGGTANIPLTPNTHQRLTSLAYQVGAPADNTCVPQNLRTTFELQVPGAPSPVTFNSSDLTGHRLSVTFDSSLDPVLSFDGVVETTGTPQTPGTIMRLTTSITHPYSSNFADVTDDTSLKMVPSAGAVFLIGTAWGPGGRGMVERHRKLLQQNIAANPGNPNAEPVLGESLAVLASTYDAQTSRYDDIVDRAGDMLTILQHEAGIYGFRPVGGTSTGPYTDISINDGGPFQLTNRPSGGETLLEGVGLAVEGEIDSVFESGTIEQTQPGVPAASSTKLLDIAANNNDSQTGNIFDINNPAISGDDANYYTNTIRPVLLSSGYTTGTNGTINDVDNLVADGYRIIAPQDGVIPVGQWVGSGFYGLDGTGGISSLIGDGQAGGNPGAPDAPAQAVPVFATSAQPSPNSPFITLPFGIDDGNGYGLIPDPEITDSPWGQPADPLPYITQEPVNLVTGDYLYTRTDLALGSASFPYGLKFARYYDSGARMQSGPLGFGWTHNLVITATRDSDGFAGMGENSAIDAADAIAAVLVAFDIQINNITTFMPLDRTVLAAEVDHWLMDQLTKNVVRVSQAGSVESFVQLADCSFNAPLGSAVVMTQVTTTQPCGGNITYTTKSQNVLSFNTAGNLATWQSPAGMTVTFNYDSATPPKLTSVSNNLGRTLTLSYSSSSPPQLTEVSDNSSPTRSVSFTYDSSGNLSTAHDATEQVTTFSYDQPGRLTQIFYPSHPTTAFVTNTYDTLGRVMTQANANNASGFDTTWSFFLAGSRSEEDDPFGTQHVMYNTVRGKILTDTRDAAGLDRVTTNTYDGHDRLLTTTAPEGNSVGYTYDAKNNVLTTTAAPKPGSSLAPETWTFTYDPTFNKVTSVTDPRTIVTTSSYNGTTGTLTTTVADSGSSPHFNATQSFTYTSVGQVQTATDPLNIVTQFGYDTSGNLTSVTRDVGTGHLNQVTGMGYDSVGNTTSVTDPNGHVTKTAYDAMRRMTQVTLPAPSNMVRSIIRDADGRVTKTQDAITSSILRTTSATYTLSGKLQTSVDANGNTITYAYDLLDRMNKVTDPENRVTSSSFDTLSRLATVTNTAIQATPLESYSYSPNGREASFTDARNNATNYAYDGFDRLSQMTYPGSSFEALTYDADSNVLTRQTRAGQTISFAYDTLNRVTTETPPAPEATATYNYDLDGRLTGLSDNSAAIKQIAVPGGGSGVRYTTFYYYDSDNRMSGVDWDTVNIPAVPPTSYATLDHWYNKDRQRVYQTTSDQGLWYYPSTTASTTNYSVNSLNQYTAAGSVAPTYDANGNLTSDGTFTYTYDAENRLISAVGAGNTVSYAYDARGKRKSKTVNGTTTFYVWDADREVMEYDGATGNVLHRFVYGSRLDEALSIVDAAGNRSTPVPDIQGSRVALIDGPTGTVTKTGYLPYGESADTTGAYRYTGRRIDAETNGLYYYRARMYAPGLGRFMQPDPIGYVGGRNLYAYVEDDPLNKIDPFGDFAQVSTSGNNVTINLPVIFQGSGATPSATAAYTQAMQNAWTGTFGNYNVTLNVTTPAPGTPSSQYNTVTISPLTGNACGGAPCTVGSNNINVAPLTGGSSDAYNLWASGHEAGHAMGLPDMYYTSGPNAGSPYPMYNGNIMGQAFGTPDNQDISNAIYLNNHPGPSGGGDAPSDAPDEAEK